MSLATETVQESYGGIDFSSEVEEIDMSPALIYPEQRMWAAVALLLIDDYEVKLKEGHRIWFESKRKPDAGILTTLRQLRRVAKSPWFRTVCEYVNVHEDHIENKLNALDKAYRLEKIQFTINGDKKDGGKNLHIAR